MALEKKIIAFEELPDYLKTKESVLKALKTSITQLDWSKLPSRFQSDVDCAYACFDQSPFNILEAWNCLSRDCIWQWVAQKLSKAAAVDDYWTADRVPDWVRRDQDLLLRIVPIVPEAVLCADTSEWDEDYVKALLEANPMTMPCFSHELDESLSKVVWSEAPLNSYLAAMSSDKASFGSLCDTIPDRVAQDPGFILAWVRLGGPIRSWIYCETLQSEDVFLAFARNHPNYSYDTTIGFSRLPTHLRQSLKFRDKLLELTHAANFYERYQEEDLADVDFDIQARALGDFRRLRGLFDYVDLMDCVSEKLEMLQRFILALCGMTRSSSPLHQLSGDPGIRRHIASFSDIPVSCEFFQAATNMEYNVFHPYTRPIKFRFGNDDYPEE